MTVVDSLEPILDRGEGVVLLQYLHHIEGCAEQRRKHHDADGRRAQVVQALADRQQHHLAERTTKFWWV